MRALVRLGEEERARTLGDALSAEGIENRVEPSREGGLIVWVRDELDMDRARALLERFEEDPFDPVFQRARRVAEARRRERAAAEKKSRHRTVVMRERWRSPSGWGRLTLGLVTASVAVTLLAGTLLSPRGGNVEVIEVVAFSWAGLLRRFELWRLITPIFLHFGFIHLLFDMWWLKDFGAAIEHRHGTLTLAAMVLVMAVVPNLAQAFFSTGLFGGMSGVIYGLFGYLWIRGRFDPDYGYSLQRSTVVILIGWMILGFVGLFGMANMAHLGGLVVGAIWGLVAAKWPRRRVR